MSALTKAIAGLLKPDRAIDALCADLFGWWPEDYTRKSLYGGDRRYKVKVSGASSTKYVDCPYYTRNLSETIDEAKKMGLSMTCFSHGACLVAHGLDPLVAVARKDGNGTLAGLEALVLAVTRLSYDRKKLQPVASAED